MNSVSPGTIAVFQPNEYYPSTKSISRRSPTPCAKNTK